MKSIEIHIIRKFTLQLHYVTSAGPRVTREIYINTLRHRGIERDTRSTLRTFTTSDAQMQPEGYRENEVKRDV